MHPSAHLARSWRLLLAMLCLAALAACHDSTPTRTASSEQVAPAPPPASRATPGSSATLGYTCSMHPEVHADHPGSCPICGMELVPAASDHVDTSPHYACPMHPEVHADHPGPCPVCGMELAPASSAAEAAPEPLPSVAIPCRDCRAQVRALLDAALVGSDSMVASLAVSSARDDALPALARDPRGLVRLYAANELGERSLGAATGELRQALIDDRDDPMGLARLAAVGALTKLGAKDVAARALRPWLTDPRPVVRVVALAYVDELPTLRPDVARLAAHDSAPEVRDEAELMLALLGDADARGRVLARTDQASFRVQMRLDATHARPRILRALTQRRADPELEFIIQSSAATALLSVGDERGRTALHQQLAAADETHRLALLQLLMPFAAQADRPVVEPLLAAADPATRVQAAALWWKLERAR